VRKTITIADSTDATIKIIEIAGNDDGYASQISEFRADHTLIFITDYVYDTNGNCTGIIETDRIGQKSSILFKYDTAGNLIEETYHASNGKSYLKYAFEYDTSGNLIRQTEIDARGNISSVTDYIYNHFGLLLKETWYDPHKNPRSVIEYTYKPY
jgi:YD repeat-containing protein